MTKNEALTKIKKLQEFERGDGNEKANATYLIEKLMAANEITSEEVQAYEIPKPRKKGASSIAKRLRQIRGAINVQKRHMHMGLIYRNDGWAVQLAEIEMKLDSLIGEMERAYRKLPSQSGQNRAPNKTVWKKGDLDKMQGKYWKL